MKYRKQNISGWIQDVESMLEKIKSNQEIMSNPGMYEGIDILFCQRGMDISVYTGRDTTYLLSDDSDEQPIIQI
jgi:hypothetical protein